MAYISFTGIYKCFLNKENQISGSYSISLKVTIYMGYDISINPLNNPDMFDTINLRFQKKAQGHGFENTCIYLDFERNFFKEASRTVALSSSFWRGLQ